MKKSLLISLMAVTFISCGDEEVENLPIEPSEPTGVFPPWESPYIFPIPTFPSSSPEASVTPTPSATPVATASPSPTASPSVTPTPTPKPKHNHKHCVLVVKNNKFKWECEND